MLPAILLLSLTVHCFPILSIDAIKGFAQEVRHQYTPPAFANDIPNIDPTHYQNRGDYFFPPRILNTMENAGIDPVLLPPARKYTNEQLEQMVKPGTILKSGKTKAMNELGWMLIQGNGIPKDKARGIELILTSARAGNYDGMAYYGHLILESKPSREQLKMAVQLIELSAAKKSAVGINLLGQLHLAGITPSGINVQSALHYFREAALKGDANALVNLGKMYQVGNGIGVDLAKADGYFGMAALLGNPRANFHLARLGPLFESQFKELHPKMIENAAKLGFAPAQAYLAEKAHAEGQPLMAVYWHDRAANKGFEASAAYMNHLYQDIAARDSILRLLDIEAGRGLTEYEMLAQKIRRKSAPLFAPAATGPIAT